MKISDLVVDMMSDEFILITNGISLDMTKPDEYVPYEGMVMYTEGNTLYGWSLQNIQGRCVRLASPAEKEIIMPQFEARIEELRK
jgi:hypothetical protein